MLVESYSLVQFDEISVSLPLVRFVRPLGSLYWSKNFPIFGTELCFQYQMHNACHTPLFSVWQNVKIYEISPRLRSLTYVTVPSCRAYRRQSRLLCVPTLLVLSHYSNLTYDDSTHGNMVRTIVKPDTEVATSFLFLTTGHDGVSMLLVGTFSPMVTIVSFAPSRMLY